jgi:2'-5' RNA ligase
MSRVFIGVFVPENFRKKISLLQEEMKKLPMKAKFVERENLHISLSFLGEVAESDVVDIIKKLDFISSHYKKFEVHITNFKLIPNQNYIRVIALDALNGELRKISQHIKQDIGGDVKPPHLTLCRVKNIEDKKIFFEKISQLNADIGSFIVDSINLIESRLQRTGPIYTKIHESKLG